MIKKISRWVLVLFFLSLVVGSSSCSPPAGTAAPVLQSEVRVTETRETILPGITRSAATKMPTLTLTTKPTTKTPEPNLTVRPFTRTPGPTLSPEKARQLIDNAQKTNLGCELPCWWGITPGKTSWDEAQAFFSALNAKIEYWAPHYSITVFYPNRQKALLGLEIFPSDDGVVESIRTSSSYSMAEVLAKFGRPAQVWFYSSGVRAYQLPPSASLMLLYPKQGLLFYDLLEEGEYFEGGSTIRVCAKHLAVHSYPGFYLWAGNTQKTFEQIKGYLFDDTESWRFRPLEEVTNMDIPAFTKAFSLPNSTACFLSPINIWPFPLP